MFLGVALRSSLFIYGEVILRSEKKNIHTSWCQFRSVLIIVVDANGLAKVAKQRTTAMDLGCASWDKQWPRQPWDPKITQWIRFHQGVWGGWLLLWGIHSQKLDGFPIWCAMVAMVWDKKCDLAPSKPMRQMHRLPVLEFSSRPRVGFQLSCVGHRPAPKTTVPIPDRHI